MLSRQRKKGGACDSRQIGKGGKGTEDRDRKLAIKRQEEMAKAVKIAQAKREAAREQERRAA